VYSVDLHLIGYPHGDKRWPEDFADEDPHTELIIARAQIGATRNSCPRCSPLYWSWQWDDGTQKARRRWRIIDCDLEPGL
jgi:hypothetical protein